MSEESAGPTPTEQAEAILGVVTFLATLHEDSDWDQLRIVWANPMVMTPALRKLAMDSGTVDERRGLVRYENAGYIVTMDQPERIERDPAAWLKPRARRAGKAGKRK